MAPVCFWQKQNAWHQSFCFCQMVTECHGILFLSPWWLVSWMHGTNHHGDWCQNMHGTSQPWWLVSDMHGTSHHGDKNRMPWHSVLVNGDWCHICWFCKWWLNVMAFSHHWQWWQNAMAFSHHWLKQNALAPVHSVFDNGDRMPWHSVLVNGDWCHICWFCKQNALAPVHSVFDNGDRMSWHSVTID